MGLSELLSYMTEENLAMLVDKYRSLGPLPGLLLPFMKSFIPPLPTLVIISVNAAVYGLWLGFLYSWIGIVGGCLVTFAIVKKVAGHPYLVRWSQKPKVQKSLVWARRQAFNYVFLLSLFPVGPFVVINMAAGLVGMRFRSFLVAVLAGKAVMVMSVSFIGYDIHRFIENPARLIYVVLFVGASMVISKRIEKRFSH
ncbi:TVP38/TMEM64 family protein [Paenibacillus chondroitinus]|uniref:TVP38/TMEM64 family membrane protein n=1 Tax=Paenibacillus chondroitinus TaxID=59842 RepID=A0ABU6DH40_9BACL|nr:MULTISPECIES: TVP38/TMEM64 family protein [Paenibacillus]MCY9661421.1 TVP38/TMEM64 family protein [Paenibacillus anseongense]MEB4797084.1 TVP38/TMEM64 family protein [Paenibacillus chondroitinus]